MLKFLIYFRKRKLQKETFSFCSEKGNLFTIFNRMKGKQEERKIGRKENRKKGKQDERKIGRKENRKKGRQEERKIGRKENRKKGKQEERKIG